LHLYFYTNLTHEEEYKGTNPYENNSYGNLVSRRRQVDLSMCIQ
jgi:hypothetical protein